MKKYAITEKMNSSEVKRIRNLLKLKQTEFADLLNVSVKTIERWEKDKSEISGPAVTLLNILQEHPLLEEELKIPEKAYPMRIWYYWRDYLCTLIEVDERLRKIRIRNYTKNYLMRAFGREESPDFDAYERFLESRCFPESRDKMKLILEDLDIPFYEPLMIIEKTEGRMAEDDFWIMIER